MMDEHDYQVTGLRGPDNRELYVIDRPNHGQDTGPATHVLGHHAGAMWREPALDTDGRECWVIVLPNRAGSWWTTYGAQGSHDGWSVTGSAPALTVNPSINAGDAPGPGNWHGWIRDGMLTP
jgi:hypothetical protein